MKTAPALMNKFAKGKPVETKKNNSIKNVLVYTRVSSKDQEDNLSLPTQMKYCVEYSEKRCWNILEYFGQRSESAKTDERKEFKKLMDYARKHHKNISSILVYSLDRFSRSETASLQSSMLRKLGIEIISVTQPIDTSSPSGILQQDITFLFNRWDNMQRRSRCMTGMKEKLLKGEWIGCVPLGYSYDRSGNTKEQTIVTNKDAVLVKKAFIMKVRENLSHMEIAKILSGKGLKITHKKLSKMLRNPFYCGYVSHNLLDGEVIKGKHPAIISQEFFLQANEILKQNASGYKKDLHKDNLPLKQFLLCDCCKQAMTGYFNKKKKIYYYKCYTPACHNNVSAKQTHQLFATILEHIQLDEHLIGLYKEQLIMTYHNKTKEDAEDRKAINTQLHQMKEEYEELEKRYAFGKIERAMFDKFGVRIQEQIRKIEEQKEKIEVKISNPEKLAETAAHFFCNLQEIWLQEDLEKRLLLQKIIFPEGIYYDKQNKYFRTTHINELIFLIASLSDTFEQKIRRLQDFYVLQSPPVESEGFEPPDLLQSTVFKTAAFDRSASSLIFRSTKV